MQPARAAIDAYLDTSAFVPGQPSTVSFVGTVTEDGPSWGVLCAIVFVEYDPSKISVSNFQGNTAGGWSCSAYNLDNNASGWACAIFLNSGDYGQTETGTIGTFTVTPANNQVDVNDCATFRLDGDSSQLCDQDFYVTYPSSPCSDRDYPISDNPGEELPTMERMNRSIETPDFTWTIRALRLAIGVEAATPTGNPNAMEYFLPTDPRLVGGTQDPRYRNGYYLHNLALTEQDQATVELADDKFWLLPCPGGTCDPTVRIDPAYRHFSIADAVMALKIPYSEPSAIVWDKPFLGNWKVSTGNAANATGEPALADIDGDGKLDAVFPMGTRNGRNYADPRRDQINGSVSTNPNRVYAISYDSTKDDYDVKTGWPQPTRDAAYGVSVGDMLPSTSGLEVIASNFQDAWRKSDGAPYDVTFVNLFSRPYVWTAGGGTTGVFADSDNPDRAVGVGLGHANTAAPIFDATGDGVPEILFTSIGVYNPNTFGENGGGVKALNANGSLAFQTQETNDAAAWYTGTIPFTGLEKNVAELNAPPVQMRANGGSSHITVVGTYSGDVYGWNASGSRVISAQTDIVPDPQGSHRAQIDNPFAAGDVDNDGHDEVVVGTGRNLNYYDWDFNISNRYNDGAIYCWSDTGAFRWRYPSSGWRPAFASGVAIGRLQGATAAPSIVAVDSSGYVVALNGSTGAEQWHYDIKPLANNTQKFQHRYLQGCIAEPLILDVNGDGYQDVIVGTTSGWIYILDGNMNATTRLLGQTHTFQSSQAVWRPNPMTATNDYVLEAPYEEIVGLAAGPMDPNHSSSTMLFVTSSRAATTPEVQPVGGHAMVIDLAQVLGHSVTWQSGRHDWTQFQQNAQRVGVYAGS